MGKVGVISPPYFQSGDPETKGTPTLNVRGRRAFMNVYGRSENQVGRLKAREREMNGSISSSCQSPLQWDGTYEAKDNWRNIVTPESFVHPAKMAPRLCERIFEHLEELKAIEAGSLVVDFMAGTGTTNVIASMRGYRSVSIELEPRFVRIEAGNRRRLGDYLGSDPNWKIIQGDSRRLSKFIGNGGASIVSPPYNEDQEGGHPTYMDEGSRKGVIPRGKGGVGNIPKLGVISPPYQDMGIASNDQQNSLMEEFGREWGRHAHEKTGWGRYSTRPSNVGNLKVGMISPPYQNMVDSKSDKRMVSRLEKIGRHDLVKQLKSRGSQLSQKNRGDFQYGSSNTNIGRAGDDTYESAMLQIYREAHKAGISPLVTVTKNPTRKGSLVRLDLITADLLRKAGYQIFDYHQAVLFKSHDESSINLDGKVEESISHKGRIGFFKQLSLKKGNVAASWEDVIFAG